MQHDHHRVVALTLENNIYFKLQLELKSDNISTDSSSSESATVVLFCSGYTQGPLEIPASEVAAEGNTGQGSSRREGRRPPAAAAESQSESVRTPQT